MQHVAGEILIEVSVGAAHIVVVLMAALGHLLELRHDEIIGTAVAIAERAHAIIDFLAAVNAQHNIPHLLVYKVEDLIGEQDAVRRDGETELLVVLLFLAAAVSDKLLDNIPVHKRLAPEEIHLQVDAAAGILDEEIECLAADLIAHERTAAHVFALVGKAVFAAEVAVMRHMQAERFHHGVALLEIDHGIAVRIVAEQGAVLLQGAHVADDLLHLTARDFGAIGIALQHGGRDLLRRVILPHGDHVVGEIVHHMDAAAVHIQHNIVTVAFILMNHGILQTLSKKMHTRNIAATGAQARRRARRFRGSDTIERLLLLVFVFAVLVCNRAGRLAGRLAGGLALAAAADLQGLLQVSGIQSLNALHRISLLSVESQAQRYNPPGLCLYRIA